MPFVETPTVESVIKKKSDRAKIEKWFLERSFAAYSLSWERLFRCIKQAMADAETGEVWTDDHLKQRLYDCVIAFTEDELKERKVEFTGEIGPMMALYGADSIRGVDPFGRPMDYIFMQDVPSYSFKKDAAMEILVRRYKMDAADVAAAFAEATKETKWSAVQARLHKETKGKK